MMQYHNKYLITMKVINLKMLMVLIVAILLFSQHCSSLKLQHKKIEGQDLYRGKVDRVQFFKGADYIFSFQKLFQNAYLEKQERDLKIRIKNRNCQSTLYFFQQQNGQITVKLNEIQFISKCNRINSFGDINEIIGYLKSITRIKQEGRTWTFSNKEGAVFKLYFKND